MKKTVSKIIRIDDISMMHTPEVEGAFNKEQEDGFEIESISTTTYSQEVKSNKPGMAKEPAIFLVITALLKGK